MEGKVKKSALFPLPKEIMICVQGGVQNRTRKNTFARKLIKCQKDQFLILLVTHDFLKESLSVIWK